jgi:hypothetical protein
MSLPPDFKYQVSKIDPKPGDRIVVRVATTLTAGQMEQMRIAAHKMFPEQVIVIVSPFVDLTIEPAA